jgi:hypothetical protein
MFGENHVMLISNSARTKFRASGIGKGGGPAASLKGTTRSCVDLVVLLMGEGLAPRIVTRFYIANAPCICCHIGRVLAG